MEFLYFLHTEMLIMLIFTRFYRKNELQFIFIWGFMKMC